MARICAFMEPSKGNWIFTLPEKPRDLGERRIQFSIRVLHLIRQAYSSAV